MMSNRVEFYPCDTAALHLVEAKLPAHPAQLDDQTRAAIRAEIGLDQTEFVEIDDEGYVKIVDRRKELIINVAGKNMSPADIEQKLKSASPLIGQAICIGDRRRYNVALLVLDPDAAAAYAMKLKRKPINAKYDAEIEALYR